MTGHQLDSTLWWQPSVPSRLLSFHLPHCPLRLSMRILWETAPKGLVGLCTCRDNSCCPLWPDSNPVGLWLFRPHPSIFRQHLHIPSRSPFFYLLNASFLYMCIDSSFFFIHAGLLTLSHFRDCQSGLFWSLEEVIPEYQPVLLNLTVIFQGIPPSRSQKGSYCTLLESAAAVLLFALFLPL